MWQLLHPTGLVSQRVGTGNPLPETANSPSAIGQHCNGPLPRERLSMSHHFGAIQPVVSRVVVIRQSEVRGPSPPSPRTLQLTWSWPAVELGSQRTGWGCVLGSRALAKSVHLLGPALEAAVILAPFPVSATSRQQPSA